MTKRIVVKGLIVAAALVGAVEAKAEKPPSTVALPGAVSNTLSALAQTAAIVEGTVAAIESEYAEDTGPWTNIRLSSVVVHRGRVANAEKQPTEVIIRQKGGSYPDGRVLLVSTQSEFVRGKRYVVLLRNTGWFLSPVVGQLALRVETEGAQQFLVGQQEGAVQSVSQAGVVFSEPLFAKEEDATFRHAPRKRVSDRGLPANALGVKAFVEALDQELAVRGLALSGRFYDEPVTKSKKIALAPNGVSQSTSDSDAQSRPDTRPNP